MHLTDARGKDKGRNPVTNRRPRPWICVRIRSNVSFYTKRRLRIVGWAFIRFHTLRSTTTAGSESDDHACSDTQAQKNHLRRLKLLSNTIKATVKKIKGLNHNTYSLIIGKIIVFSGLSPIKVFAKSLAHKNTKPSEKSSCHYSDHRHHNGKHTATTRWLTTRWLLLFFINDRTSPS